MLRNHRDDTEGKHSTDVEWIESHDNSADKISKLFFDPIDQINSKIFRESPVCLRNVNCTKHVFFYISKDTEKFTALPEEMLKVRKKESNVLVEAG